MEGLAINLVEPINRWSRHGCLRIAQCGRHLAHEDGTPFFYLADTAWNGPLLSNEDDWAAYLADRSAKGFTAIQFIMMAPWSAAYTDADGRTAFDRNAPFKINEDFFLRMDARVDAINAAGLLAVPVLAWAAKFGGSARHNPGVALPERALERLIRYQVSRYASRNVLWLLAGDGRYGWMRSWKWKRLGRAVFGKQSGQRAPVGLHPMGTTWPYPRFKRESWLNVLGYQSSHSSDAKTLNWLLKGPPAQAWREETRPIINLEPCYEGIHNWAMRKPFTNAEVRRAMYGSLLNAPTAGVTYGAHGVWSWETVPREPLNHPGSGVARTWKEAAQFPGSFDVQRIAMLFNSIDWWRLRPAPELLLSNAGSNDPDQFISLAATAERDLILAYLPRGGKIQLESDSRDAQWYDPRIGSYHVAEISTNGTCLAPDERDWVLLSRK